MEGEPDYFIMPSPAVEKLQCTICTKPLSVFPVYLSSELGPICGRCPVADLKNIYHNTTYEYAVEEFKFPCCNLPYGCPEYLLPSETKEHERICLYRQVKCPSVTGKGDGQSVTDCNWNGPCKQLVDHYERAHSALLMKQLDFEVNFINTFDDNYLLLYGDEIFIFKRKADAAVNTLCCSVVYIGWNTKSEDFSYQIKLINPSTKAEKVFEKKPTVDLSKNITEIVASHVKNDLGNPPVIIGSIEITVEDNGSNENSRDTPKKPSVCYDMLDTIECPVCYEYMVPPIYQCLGGHSICSVCKESIRICPSCKEDVKDTRNFILEKMVGYLKYPCKNWENGCTHVSEGSTIKVHEKSCEFGSFECPLKDYYSACQFKSKLSHLHDHIINLHHDSVLEIDTIHVPFDEGFLDDEDAYILRYLDKLFILHFRIKDHAFWWCFQLIGSPENCKKYLCEIDIVDNASKKNRIYLKSHCSCLTNRENCFKEGPYFKLNFDQVEHLITDTFSYRVRVLKDCCN